MKERNHFIELERFLACMIITLFHLGVGFESAWLFVEFFFMVTGFFTAAHVEKNRERIDADRHYPVRYTAKKIWGLMPYTVVSVLLMAGVIITENHLYESARTLYNYFCLLPANLLNLGAYGVVPTTVPVSDGFVYRYMVNGTLWYVGVLAVALPIVIWILKAEKKHLGAWAYTALPLLLYGFYVTMFGGSLNGWQDGPMIWAALWSRAVASNLAGAGAYHLSRYIGGRSFKTGSRLLLTAAELGAIVLVFAMSSTNSSGLAFTGMLLLVLSLSLTLSGQTFTTAIRWRWLTKFFDFLGKISLPMYCLQLPVFNITRLLIGWDGTLRVCGNIVIVFAFSAGMYFVVEAIKKGRTKARQKAAAV